MHLYIIVTKKKKNKILNHLIFLKFLKFINDFI